MKSISTLLIIISLLSSSLSFSKEINNIKTNHVKLSLTDSGLERLLNTVLDTTSFLANNLFSNPPEINYSSLEKDTVPCSDKSWLDFKKLPININLNHIKSQFKLGSPRVSCKQLSCVIALPIEYISLTTDLSVKKCSDNSDIFGIKKLGLNLSNPEKEIFFNLNLSITKDQNGRGMLTLVKKDSISNIPEGSLGLELEGESSIEELKKKLLGVIGNLAINLPVGAIEKEKFNWFIDRAKPFLDSRLKDQAGTYIPLDEKKAEQFVKESIDSRYFSNKKSKSIFKALQKYVFSDQLAWVGKRLYSTINNSLSKVVLEMVTKELDNTKIFSKKIDFKIPGIYIENLTDLNAIKKRYKMLNEDLDKCETSKVYWGTCSFHNVDVFFKMAKHSNLEPVLDMAKELQKRMKDVELNRLEISKGEILDDDSYVYLLKYFRSYNKKYMPYLVKKLEKNINAILNSEQVISLHDIIKKDDSVEFVFRIDGKNPALDISFKGLSGQTIPALRGRDYDLAMSININSINNLLDWQVRKKLFNFCMNSNHFVTCKNRGFFDTITTLKFNHAPLIVRNSDHYILSLKQAEADFEFAGLPTNWIGSRAVIDVDIPFNFALLDEGKTVSFEAAGEIDASYDFLDMSFKSVIPKLLGLVHAPLISVVMGLGADIAQTSLSKGFNIIGEDSIVREIVEIVPHPDKEDELLIYLKINRTLDKNKKDEILEDKLKEKNEADSNLM